MGEIYAIIKGEYSDWEIIGYCKNEDEAKRYCEYHNENIKNGCCENAYYKVVKNIDVNTTINKFNEDEIYILFNIGNNKQGYKMVDKYTNGYISKIDELEELDYEDIIEYEEYIKNYDTYKADEFSVFIKFKDNIIFRINHNYNSGCIYIRLKRKCGKEKAFKIACDALTEFNYRTFVE